MGEKSGGLGVLLGGLGVLEVIQKPGIIKNTND
jgi:hypothetical protein